MNYTSNFNLSKPEGTDLYNHLTIDNPNMDIIDAAMQANKLASIGAATELVSGTVHAITRSDSNQNIFKFKATGDFKAGDTITVDGVSVNAFNTGGQQLLNDAYVLSAEVICILDGTSLWVLVNKVPDADQVVFDNTGTTLSSNDVNNAIKEIDTDGVTCSAEFTNGITIAANASVWQEIFNVPAAPTGRTIIGFAVKATEAQPVEVSILYVGSGRYYLLAKSYSSSNLSININARALYAKA